MLLSNPLSNIAQCTFAAIAGINPDGVQISPFALLVDTLKHGRFADAPDAVELDEASMNGPSHA